MSANRTLAGWRPASLERLDRVKRVLDDMRTYWPLTLRQVYYQLVSAQVIPNTLPEYKALSALLTKARLQGLAPWDAMEDRARSMLASYVWRDKSAFIESSIDYFLDGYRADLMRDQPHALECWVEKDALSQICHKAADAYCVPVVVARGFASMTYKNECRDRILRRACRGKPTRILYAGDLDPSGWEMLPAMLRTLTVEMDVPAEYVSAERIALTVEQVERYGLPPSIDALKHMDSRAKKYIREVGEFAVELDALPPAIFEGIVRGAIERNLDLSEFGRARAEQQADLAELADIRERVAALVRSALDEAARR